MHKMIQAGLATIGVMAMQGTMAGASRGFGAPSRGGNVLVRVPAKHLIAYLGGRPEQPGVTFLTHVNAGKKYPVGITKTKAKARRRAERAEAQS